MAKSAIVLYVTHGLQTIDPRELREQAKAEQHGEHRADAANHHATVWYPMIVVTRVNQK